ncbi:12886_t:CDS:1 [Ambispora gerdemannii]|uniref:12886_t:CDS:1 n=1 Tax=Ambispora gerdemannii TaxID=144530 RepID=A0A9N8V075_9GLOM|nr:12886_t:CDS:1 [Ambispora gerdemannii]
MSKSNGSEGFIIKKKLLECNCQCCMNAISLSKKYLANAFQAEFIIVLKHILSLAYITVFYRVLPEFKERDRNGNRRQRLHILLRHGNLSLELAVAANRKYFNKHYKRVSSSYFIIVGTW